MALACLLVPGAAWAQAAQAAAALGASDATTPALAAAVARAEATGEALANIPDDALCDEDAIIVIYEDGADEDAAAAQQAAEQTTAGLQDAGLAVEEVLAGAGAGEAEAGEAEAAGADMATMVLATVPEGADVEDAIVAAMSVEGVAYAQPNYTYELVDCLSAETEDAGEDASAADDAALATAAVPDDPAASVSSTSKSANQYYLYGDLLDTVGVKGANVIDVWDDVTTDGAVTVVVMDTGVNLLHEDLQANLLTEYCYDIYNDCQLEADDDFCGDYSGHGTHVAGIIAATADNGTGLAGVSYNANLISYKITDDSSSGSTAWAVSAYEQMLELAEEQSDLNIHLVNLSMGTYQEMTGESDKALYTSICTAREAGILTVCAGGNGNSSTNTPYTASMYPADWEECLAVTALSTDGTNVTWSDFNEAKDISAPGYLVYSTYKSSTSSYTRLSGTSMAAPVVSGILALLWTACPDATVDEVVQAVQATADEVDDSEDAYSRNSTGYNGVVSGSAGAIDAAGAVQYLLAAWEEEHCSVGEHTGGTATCAAQATCVVCGTEYGEVDADAHSWGSEATWEWAEDCSSATATLTCEYDATHTTSATATTDAGITYEVTAAPTATEEGTGVYTACVELEGATYTSTQTVAIAATGEDSSDDDASDDDDASGDDTSSGEDAAGTSGGASSGSDATNAGSSGGGSSTSGGSTSSSGSAKKVNTAKITAKKTVKVKASRLKRKARLKKAITVKKAKGKVTYKKVSGSKRLSVTKTGKVKVKKNTKKGTYKIRVKVTVKGTAKYKKKVRTFTVKVKVC